MNKSKLGFTLAEVLLTLGIIGIVAALTMPSLIANYKRQIYSVKLKKFYSGMQQAIRLYNAQNNTDGKDWVYPTQRVEGVDEFWQKYFAPNFNNVVKTEKTTSFFYVYFADGSCMHIHRSGVLDIEFDLNCNQRPNIAGIDKHYFLLDTRSGKFMTFYWPSEIHLVNNNIPEGEEKVTADITDRKNLIRLCKYSRNYCAKLLEFDNWEFKSDYPHKL